MKYFLFIFLLLPFFEETEILVVGDSITAHGLFVRHLQDGTGYKCTAKGYTGKGTSFILKKFENEKIDKYDYVIFEAGVNNIDNPVQVMSDLQKMFDHAKAVNPTIKVVILTVVPFKGYPTWTPEKQLNLNRVNAWIMDKPKNVDITVDIYTALSTNDMQHHSTDGLHPSILGHRIMADLIKDHLYGIRNN